MEAAFFDLDKTVIAKASIAAFGRTFYRGGLISRSTILRALVSQLVYLHLGASEQKLAKVRESVLELTKGWNQKEVSRLVREALDDIVEPIIYAEAARPDRASPGGGPPRLPRLCLPEEIVRPLSEYLGAAGAIASTAVVDADGRYTGEMEFYAYGPFKADAMREVAEREGIDLRGFLRLLRLLHRRPHARSGGPPCSREPRPGARTTRPRARLGGPGVHPSCPHARPSACAFWDSGGDRCRRAGGRHRCGSGGLALRPTHRAAT